MRASLSGRLPNLRIVLRDLGRLVPTLVIAMVLASSVVALAFGELFALLPLGVTAGVSLAVAALLYLPFRRAGEAKLKHVLVTGAASWVLISFLGAIPLLLLAHAAPNVSESLAGFRDPTNAFFESVSGFTATGLTMAPHPEDLPRVFQWWRSFIEWIGGLGIVVLMLTFIASTGTKVSTLYFAEREEKVHPSVFSTSRTIIGIFILYTVGGTIALWAMRMDFWDALNHTMTAISTAGFSTRAESVGYYTAARGYLPTGIQVVLGILMLAGATNFTVHWELLRGRWRILWEDVQTRWLLLLVVVWIISLFVENLLLLPARSAASLSSFQAISAMTTTGFQTADVRPWSETAKLILSLSMFVGAASGSTGGGIKVLRAVILVRGVGWRLRRAFSPPSAVVPFRLGRKAFSEQEAEKRIEAAALLTFLWAAFIGLGVVVLLHTVSSDFTLGDMILEVTSAQGGVGMTSGITGPSMNTWAKLVLCLNMWVGRIEIIPVLMLVRSLFRGLR
jgi:trk system potassium uptake protein TrkH